MTDFSPKAVIRNAVDIVGNLAVVSLILSETWQKNKNDVSEYLLLILLKK